MAQSILFATFVVLILNPKDFPRVSKLSIDKSAVDVVIVAGGRGSRLWPLTKNIPKPLVRVAGKPLISYGIFQLVSQGLSTIYIATNYLAKHIEAALGNGQHYNAQIKYLKEDFPMDTAGALALVPARAGVDYIMLMNADIIADFDIDAMFEFMAASNYKALVCSTIVQMPIPYGELVQSTEKNLLQIEEKPTHSITINAGIYIFKKSAIEPLLNSPASISAPDLINALIDTDVQVGVYSLNGFWQDISDKNSIEQAENYLRSKILALSVS